MTLPRWHYGGYKEKDPEAIDLQLGDTEMWISVWGPNKHIDAQLIMGILNEHQARQERSSMTAEDWLS